MPAMNKTFYITTAIDYANGSPHLGHAYEKVLTDVIARDRRLRGEDVYFLTGLDEHGQKVQQSAAKQGKDPQAFCDEVAMEFQALCRDLGISNDDFIRTTEKRHENVVQALLQSLYDKGEIYQAEYAGYYSPRQEQFLQERDRDENGEWPEIYGEVIEIAETNYFFRLSKYQEWLRSMLAEHPGFIFPAYRQKQVIEFLKEPVNDLCISRPKERLSWGIEIPFDPDYVTYVWFDALTNYYSAVEPTLTPGRGFWPADYHVIGKDILVPSHSVYWPCMLQAAGLPLPRHLLVHGWWMVSGAKMSKTLGNVVRPLDLMEQFGADAFRYFLTREMNVGQDSDFSVELFLARYNNDLGNDLGNLVSRLLNMGHRYCGGILPAAVVDEEHETALRRLWEETHKAVLDLNAGFQFHTGLERTFTFIRGINRYAEQRAPWKLAKSGEAEDRRKLETALAVMAEGLRLATALLAPVMPGIAHRVQTLLGQEKVNRWEGTLQWGNRLDGATLGEKTILFPRPEQAAKG